MIKFVSRLNLNGSRVDRAKGIIKGVSLIALGEAKGHNKLCDQKTLESVRDCAKTYKDGLRVKFNPETFTHGPAGMAGRIPANTIRIEDDKTVGDLHLYRSYPENIKEYLYEMAEETPGNIGLSIEFTGDDEEIKGQKFARCSEIYLAQIVDLPAANPTGLFAVGDNKDLTTNQNQHTTDSDETTELTMKPEDVKQLAEAILPDLKKFFAPMIAPPVKKVGFADATDDEKKAAGITDEDDDKTKEEKMSTYRASQEMGEKKISEMSGKEFSQLVAQSNMQFFRAVGGKPAKISADVETGKGDDDFEKLVDTQMKNGAKNRGTAINRVRQDHPAAYNAFMDKQHPNKQQMVKK